MLTRRPRSDVVVLIDVDNTLLDNDRFSAELDAHLTEVFGEAGRRRYRALYESMRDRQGYADYLEPLQGMREPFEDDAGRLRMSAFLLDFPFDALVYPGAFDALDAISAHATTVILSDGDFVFQPRKIQRSGLWDAVQGRVLVTVHKQRTLDAVQQAYPARHYVMVDDKPALLSDIKAALGDRVTTVFVRQGHYAHEGVHQGARTADVGLGSIAELAGLDVRAYAAKTASQQECT